MIKYLENKTHIFDQKTPRKVGLSNPLETYRDENGFLHAENQPALVYRDGSEYYYNHGLLHNLNGFALINKTENDKRYYIFGKYIEDEREYKKIVRLLKLTDLGMDEF